MSSGVPPVSDTVDSHRASASTRAWRRLTRTMFTDSRVDLQASRTWRRRTLALIRTRR